MIVLVTTAQGPNNLEKRADEYTRALSWYRDHGYSMKVVECFLNEGPSIIEPYCLDVVYSGTHNPRKKNKGVLEATALQEAFKKLPIAPKEMVVKVTGRYFPTSGEFFKEAESTKADAIVLPLGGQAFFGCIGMRYYLFESFLNSLDLEFMETEMVNIELRAMQWIRNNANADFVERVCMDCNIAFNGVINL